MVAVASVHGQVPGVEPDFLMRRGCIQVVTQSDATWIAPSKVKFATTRYTRAAYAIVLRAGRRNCERVFPTRLVEYDLCPIDNLS